MRDPGNKVGERELEEKKRKESLSESRFFQKRMSHKTTRKSPRARNYGTF